VEFNHITSPRLHDSLTVFGIAILFAAPYLSSSPARYLIADLAIVTIVAWRFRTDTIRRIGLSIPLRHGCAAVISFGLLFLLAQAFVEQIAIETHGWRPAFSLSQVFHQEIVLRGLLLGALIRWRYSSAVLVAILFASLHPLFYWWAFDLLLPPTSVATLFVFGLATNLLFVRTGHIAFSFAVHAAWNLARFHAEYMVRGQYLSEAQTFAIYEGSGYALGAAVALLLYGMFLAPGINHRNEHVFSYPSRSRT
jgi:membrane protease YdiL (CAAX protease family)